MIISETLFLLADLQVALFLALRVFALWGQNYVLASIVLILEMVPFATNLFNDIVYIYLNVPVGDDSSSCTALFPYSARTQTMWFVLLVAHS
ncbi:hypothetical protein PsYK624_007600 [Phanerochaete sordida]|uniref:Uncharacterized protein n=1 Tax=Phanerochaete sordida TaxID=48140 RepID=A0A9P3L7P6_9APHY|nr:hypothetical protein PsYK624_007600 [Phanerochaete sordida]